MELVLGLIIAIIAFVAGIFSGKYIAPSARHIKELEETLEESKKQHQSYKDNVAEHFSESAHMFGDITEKYRSLYEHMSSGAYNLCDRRNIPRELSTSHVNILAVESPEIAPKLNPETTQESQPNVSASPESFMVDVSREGLSPIDPKSQILIQKHKAEQSKAQDSDVTQENTAEIIDLDTQRNEDTTKLAHEQAKDYAIKAKGVINHNSLNRDDVST